MDTRAWATPAAFAAHPAPLPAELITALVAAAAQAPRSGRAVEQVLARPDVTAEHTRDLLDQAIASDNYALVQVVAPAHVRRLPPGEALDLFMVQVAELRRLSGFHSNQVVWGSLANLVVGALNLAQRTYLAASTNLLAAALAAANSGRADRLLAIEHIHRLLPTTPMDPTERRMLVTYTCGLIDKIRKTSVWDGQTAVLSATTPETISHLYSCAAGALTTLEVRHLVRVVALPALDVDETGGNEERLLGLLQAHGDQLGDDLTQAIADHPHASPAVRDLAHNLTDAPAPDRLAHAGSAKHMPSEPVMAELVAQVAALNAPWHAALSVLESLPGVTSVAQAVTVLNGVLT